jgi:hypothetical protein
VERLVAALKGAPIPGSNEPMPMFRARQDKWLNSTYREALSSLSKGRG